jgi:hypothetical protein
MAKISPMTDTTHPAILKAQEIYERHGDLAPHEQVLLTAVHQATMAAIRTRARAQHDYGYGSKTYLATAFTADGKEKEDLAKALAVYREALEQV